MLTMLLVSGFLLKGTKTALSDLDPLLSTLLVFVLLSTLDCGYLLFKASKTLNNPKSPTRGLTAQTGYGAHHEHSITDRRP